MFQATDKAGYVWFVIQVAEIGEKSMAALHRIDESTIGIPSEIEETMVCILPLRLQFGQQGRGRRQMPTRL